MKMLLKLMGLFEAGTGLALLVVPALVVRLLLGAELVGVADPVARVAGIALTALGIGCLAGSVWLGMWLYTAIVTLFLLYLGVATQWHGPLLWPAVVVHGVLTVLLARRRPARLPEETAAGPRASTPP